MGAHQRHMPRAKEPAHVHMCTVSPAAGCFVGRSHDLGPRIVGVAGTTGASSAGVDAADHVGGAFKHRGQCIGMVRIDAVSS